jgi:hypothetical protein
VKKLKLHHPRGGGVNPYFFLHIYSSWVEIRLPTENQPSSLPGSALKVCVVVGGGGWVGRWVLKVSLVLALA